MAYLNFKLAKEKNLSPRNVLLLQLLFQNTNGDESVFLEDYPIESLKSSTLVVFVKGKKTDTEYKKARLSTKGKKIYRELTTYKTTEKDCLLYDYLEQVYKSKEKQIGNRNKIINYIAAFRLESGLTHKEIFNISKQFLNDSDNMEYNNKLEYMFFKPDNIYEKFKLENSRLWLYYTENNTK